MTAFRRRIGRGCCPTPGGTRGTGRSGRRVAAPGRALAGGEEGDAWVNKGEICPMIKRLDPTFDLKENGHTSFSGMVKALEAVVEVKKGDNDQLVRLR
jgi:hypothetical protein